jgi:hypothetical protein
VRLRNGRDGPKYFLRDYRQILLADGYGGYNGVVAGNHDHARRVLGSCTQEAD